MIRVPSLPLSVKLAGAFVAILLPIFGVVLYDFYHDRQYDVASTLATESRSGQLVAALVDNTYDDALRAAKAIASDPAVSGLDAGAAKQLLDRTLPAYPHYVNMSVFNARGDQVAIAQAAPTGAPFNIADRPYFQQVMSTGQPVISELLIGRAIGRPATIVSVPITDKSGQVVGVFDITVDAAYFQNILSQVAVGPGQAIGILDRTGRLAAFTGSSSLTWDQRDLSSLPAVQEAIKGNPVRQSNLRQPLLGNADQIAVLTPAPDSGWIALVSTASDVALAPAAQSFQVEAAALGIILLLCILLAFILGKLITSPIATIVKAAKSVAGGDLQARAKVKTGDELQTLGEAFNTMADRLEERAHDSQKFIQMREEFISLVAHDLRTPITVVSGYVSLLSRAATKRGASPEEQKAIKNIRSSVGRLDRMVSDLLDASRIEAAHLRLEIQRVCLADVARETVERLRTPVGDHPLRTRLEGDIPDVMADPERIEQVLGNLITNAAKYSPEGCEIIVDVARREGECWVSVIDQGQGIPQEDLPHVFERFYKVKASSRPKESLGLGLYIAYGLVEAQCGRIWVESELGKGSTFTFALPTAPPQNP